MEITEKAKINLYNLTRIGVWQSQVSSPIFKQQAQIVFVFLYLEVDCLFLSTPNNKTNC